MITHASTHRLTPNGFVRENGGGTEPTPFLAGTRPCNRRRVQALHRAAPPARGSGNPAWRLLPSLPARPFSRSRRPTPRPPFAARRLKPLPTHPFRGARRHRNQPPP